MNLTNPSNSLRAWLGALALLGCAAGFAAAGEGRSRNLLLNPGFELGAGGLEYWRAQGGASAPTLRRWSQFRGGHLPRGARLSQPVGGLLLSGVTRYRLSAMFYTETPTRGALTLEWQGGRRVVSRALGAGQWTLLAGTVTLPAGARPTLVVSADGAAYVDEVGLEALGEVGAFPLRHPIPQSFRGMDGGNRDLNDYRRFPLHNDYKVDYCRDLAARYPGHTTIKQIAFGTIIPRADQARVYPGHWLYFRAVPVVGAVAPKGDTYRLRVSDPSRLHSFQRDGQTRLPEVAIVGKRAGGRPDFGRALHLRLLREVSPGVFDCKVLHHYPAGGARPSFAAGQALCLPHVPWRGSESWLINLDPAGPRGPRGGGAIGAYVDFIWRLVRGLSGVQFDLPYWHYDRISGYQLDIDNDGVRDDGFKQGVNVYGLGQQRFAYLLRQRLGPEALINFDGEPDKIRSWSHHDGIQIERFLFRHFEEADPRSDQYLRDRFGFQFDHLRNTVSRLDTLRPYSYGQCFNDSSRYANLPGGGITTQPPGPRDRLLRAGLASNVLLGLIHSYTERDRDWVRAAGDESDPFWPIWLEEYEDAGQAGWLGRPRSPLAQRTRGLTSLAPISAWRFRLERAAGYAASASGGGDDQRSYRVDVSGTPAGRPDPGAVRLVSQGLPTRQSGRLYTLVFEARGGTDWSYAGQSFHAIPRALRVAGLNAVSNPSTKVFVGRTWRMYALTFRAKSDTRGPISFGFSEQRGAMELRKVRLFAGSANRFLRRFEGGVVALNMSDAAWEAPLRRAARRRVPPVPGETLPLDHARVSAWDAAFLAE